MAGITSFSSSALNGLKSSAMGPVNASVNNAKGALMGTMYNTQNQINIGVNAASGAAVKGLGNAARAVLSGDFSKAGDAILGIPNDVAGALSRTSNPQAGLNAASGQASPGNALQGINARADALLQFNWYANPPAVGGATLPWYYVEQGSLPFRQLSTQNIPRRGHQEKIAKDYDVTDLQLTFFVDSSLSSLIYLQAWSNAVLGNKDPRTLNNQGLWGRPVDYWRDFSVHILAVNKQEVLTVTYLDAWPTNFDPLNVVSDSSGRHTLEVTFSVNDVHLEIKPISAFKGTLTSMPSTGNFLGASERNVNPLGSLSGALSRFF